MKLSEVKLPSNKKFGYFFTLVLAITSLYFWLDASLIFFYCTCILSLLFFSITIIKSDALLILNRLWMYFGILLSIIISPIVLKIIFFGIFTPVAFFMRIFARDELGLKLSKQNSYWISCKTEIQPLSLKVSFKRV